MENIFSKQITLDSKIESLNFKPAELDILRKLGCVYIKDICQLEISLEEIYNIYGKEFLDAIRTQLHANGFMIESEIEYYNIISRSIRKGATFGFETFNMPASFESLLFDKFDKLDRICLFTEDYVRSLFGNSDEVNAIIHLIKYVGLTFTTKEKPKADLTWNLTRFIPLISKQTCGYLKNYRIYTLEELLNTKVDISRIPGIGLKTLVGINSLVNGLGYSFNSNLQSKEELLSIDDNESLATSLGKMGNPLSVKAFNGLMRMGIDTLPKLLSLSTEELLKDRRMGETSKQEIINFLKELGYTFKPEQVTSIESNKAPVTQFPEQQLEQYNKDIAEIEERIEKKEKLLAEYLTMINQKNALLKQEQELDEQIKVALETLKSLGIKDGQKVK